MRYAAVFLGLFFFFTEQARAQQEDVFRYPLAPQTAEAFNAACLRIAEHQYIRGNFEQEKMITRLNRSLKSSGNFLIAAKLGMVWDTAVPFPSTMVLGSDFIIQSRPGGQRTVLSAQGNETFLRMAEVISTVFSGNAQGLVNNFNVYFSGSASSWEIGLTPTDKAINSFAEKIIMKGDAVIRSIIIIEQNGDSIKYILTNHSFPAGLNINEQAFFSTP